MTDLDLLAKSKTTDNTGEYEGYDIRVKGDGRVEAVDGGSGEGTMFRNTTDAKLWIDTHGSALPPDPEPGEEPTLNSINPSGAAIGSPDLTMNVNGQRFTETSLIYFNGGAEPTTFVNAGKLSTVVKPSTATVAGEFPVWVQQGSYKTDEKTFTFVAEGETWEEPPA